MAEPQSDRARLIKVLLEVSRLHTQDLDPDAMLDRILEYLNEVVPSDSASILLRRGEYELRIVAGRGYADNEAIYETIFDTRTIRRFQSILNNRLPIRIADVRESPDWVEIPGTQSIRAWIGVPLNAKGKIIGVVSLDRNTPDAFTEDDLKIAYTFANEVAVVVEHAALEDSIIEQRRTPPEDRNDSIPSDVRRPKSRILQAVRDAGPENLLPAFSTRPSPVPAAPAPAPVATPSAGPTVVVAQASSAIPAVRVGDPSTDPRLAALAGKARRSKIPTPKTAPAPRALGAGLDLAGLGLVPSGSSPAPAAATALAEATAAAAPPADIKRETLLFGKILLSNKLVSPPQLEECLKLQERIRTIGLEVRLGQLCVDRGLIDAKTLDAVLKLQRQKFQIGTDPLALRRKGLTADTDVPIGRLAMDNGVLTQAQLDEAIAIQQKIRGLGVEKRLGEILVEKGFVAEDALDGLLQVQRQRAQPSTVRKEAESRPTPPTKKRGLDDSAYESLDNELLVRLLRPSGLLTKEQWSECDRLRTELSKTGVEKRVDQIAIQRGFASADAIRRVVDMEFLKWRETAGSAVVRPAASTAAGAQKPGGALGLYATAAVVLVTLGGLVFWRITQPVEEESNRQAQIKETKVLLRELAKTASADATAAATVISPSPDVSTTSATTTTVEATPEDTFDAEAEFSRLPALFPSEPSQPLELRGDLRPAPGGGMSCVAYGRGRFVDGTRVSLTLRFGGHEVAEAEPAPEFRNGGFVGRVRIGGGGAQVLSGYYTLQAAISVPGFSVPTSRAPRAGGLGGGGTVSGGSRMIARSTLLVGSSEDITKELESLAGLYLSMADAIETAASRLDAVSEEAANRSGDTMDDWVAAAAQWDGALCADADAGIQIGLRIAAHPAPETQALFENAIGLLRQRAAAEATALARKRRLRVPPEFDASVSTTPAAAAKAARESIERLRAGARALPGRRPADAVIRELAEVARKESDDALGEVTRLISGHSDREGPSPPLPLEWITSWSERLRLLSALDEPMREFLESTERRALPGLLDQYVLLTEAEGRARLVEWLEAQKRTIPAGLRPKERRDVARLQEDRAAVLAKLQKLLPPTS